MERRTFLHALGTVVASTKANAAPTSIGNDARPTAEAARFAAEKAWLFWDLARCERLENVVLRPGRAELQPDAAYVDPAMWGLNSWPTVYHDPEAGEWRMLYSALWKPFSLMAARSDDGVRWRPLDVAETALGRNAIPDGKRLGRNHLFTLESGSAGGVYLDPIAADGYRFKAFAHQQQEPVYRRALADPQHPWHDIAVREGVKRYFNEELLLVSRDAIAWEVAPDGGWGAPHWHPEPPLFGYYNRHRGRHMMTVRPGWGDRRVCRQQSDDARRWSGPELLLQPDPLDADLVQFYGMPVFPYANGYVGLLWVFHCASSEPARSYNLSIGALDAQFVYSYDGVRFSRGFREPLVPLSSPGIVGCAAVQPSCLVETDREIRIYGQASTIQHGLSHEADRARSAGAYAITLHTLRKDGFTYLESRGGTAFLQSKPFAVLGGTAMANVAAPYGEARFQLVDLKSEPLEGFTFDDNEAIRRADVPAHPLRWRGGALDDLQGRALRIEVKFRDARLFGFRGDWHFLDAQDAWLLDDGKPIEPTRFDI